MRSELWVCGFARAGDPCGHWRVHRDTDCQQLRLLVRGLRLRHTRGIEALEPIRFRLNQNRSSSFCFDGFSSREPVSTPDQVRGRLSLENALSAAL